MKTENYSTYPKYSFTPGFCRKKICQPGKQVLDGYEAVETLSVKVRNAKKAGEIVAGIAALGIGEVTGLSFVIDDPEKFKAQARVEAIKKAKEEAKITAKNLGVGLGRIVMFNEEMPGFFPPQPRMMMAKSFDAAEAGPVAAQFETGEQKVSATVTITYEMDQ
jgi:uncharacterized protein YggE